MSKPNSGGSEHGETSTNDNGSGNTTDAMSTGSRDTICDLCGLVFKEDSSHGHNAYHCRLPASENYVDFPNKPPLPSEAMQDKSGSAEKTKDTAESYDTPVGNLDCSDLSYDQVKKILKWANGYADSAVRGALRRAGVDTEPKPENHYTPCKSCTCHNPMMSGIGCKHCMSVVMIATRTAQLVAAPQALPTAKATGSGAEPMPNRDKEENPR